MSDTHLLTHANVSVRDGIGAGPIFTADRPGATLGLQLGLGWGGALEFCSIAPRVAIRSANDSIKQVISRAA